MQKQKILDIQNLTVQFNTEGGLLTAVRNVNFSLHRGEVVGIVGESGSGKSVSSLTIMRLLDDSVARIPEGKIIFFEENGANNDQNTEGVNLLELSETEMQKRRGNDIAMIFQEPMTSLNPVHRCGAQVVEAILTHQKVTFEEAKQQTLALFEKVKLPDPQRAFRSFPHQLSGGQKQRVMIAMALSCNPSVLIADEPTTALDVTVQQRILELMKDLQRETNAAIVFITHDLGVIADIADRVIVMYKGSIVETGSVADISKTRNILTQKAF
ncbi:MAG: ABC transporter ATP-binding protein [Saprospiraceae bacterium]|nr:ABC transporter ATP-binding protein [Saprospiraceae bacterium]